MAIGEQTAVQIASGAGPTEAARDWSAAKRIAFRFCVVYFGLYIVLTQMLTSLLLATTNDSGAFELDMTRPAKAAIVWVAAHVFRMARPIVTFETGSGDRVYDWVELACILALAVLGTALWSALGRKRRSYPKLHAWFRLFVRLALAATMFTYGMVKVVPLQMPFPSLNRLVEPYGNLSPMGVLWASIGASPAYEIFVGCAEMIGGILLILPRTTMLGALVCLADATEVFTLNMTYDVPVKLLSLHMILLALFLLAPDARRLLNMFFLGRAVPRCSGFPLFRAARANRLALAIQILAGVFLIAANVYAAASGYKTYGAGRPRSPLYGIWNVETLTLDGQVRAPVQTDASRWRRVVFDRPDSMTIWSMADQAQFYAATIDAKAKTLTLAKFGGGASKANFSYARPNARHLILDGLWDSRKIHAELELLDESAFLLKTRGFHWIQDYPFNR
jgi:uncharacterized membrane protein YphA (DoxX/SURF4 family)